MTDTTKLKVEEIRELLVNQYGYDKDYVAKVKGKSKLVDMLRDSEKEDGDDDAIQNALGELDVEPDVVPLVEEVFDGFPDPAPVEPPGSQQKTWQDEDWTEYVLGLLYDNEKDEKGNPKVDGLRRVSELILGEIIEISSDPIQTPDTTNNNRATVRATVVWQRPYNELRVDGCCDVFGRNTEGKYAQHAVATAESRAESRAYRKALRLRNILTAEETVNQAEIQDDPYDKIKDSQKRTISVICKKFNIDESKFLQYNNVEPEKLDNISHDFAQQLCSKLNYYQQQLDTIPAEIRDES